MGYEIQLIVGHAANHIRHEGKHYFMVYATVDLCKPGYTCDLLGLDYTNSDGDPVWEFFSPAGDGNNAISEDCYGKIPKPIPIDDVITALEHDMETNVYRRFKWAHDLLVSMRGNTNEELSVLLWGY